MLRQEYTQYHKYNIVKEKYSQDYQIQHMVVFVPDDIIFAFCRQEDKRVRIFIINNSHGPVKEFIEGNWKVVSREEEDRAREKVHEAFGKVPTFFSNQRFIY